MILYATLCKPCQIEMLFLESIENPACERCGDSLTTLKAKDIPVEELVIWCIKRIAALEDKLTQPLPSSRELNDAEAGHEPSGELETPFVQSDRDKDTWN